MSRALYNYTLIGWHILVLDIQDLNPPLFFTVKIELLKKKKSFKKLVN